MAKKRKQEKPKEYTRRQLSHFKKQKRRQRIILITGVVVIAAIIIIPLAGWFATEFLPLHRTMMKVNDAGFNVAYYLDFIAIGRASDQQSDVSTLSNNALNNMMQGEVMKQGAKKLGVTVSDAEIKNYLKNNNLPDTAGYRGYFGYQLLAVKLRSNYFGSKVPTEAKQVHPLIMLLESEELARSIRGQVASGGNFTALAEANAIPNYQKGDYGYHLREVLYRELFSDIPLDYAFSADIGVLSEPLFDAAKQKQVGYWLIRIVDRPEPGKVAVQALLLSDNVTALDVKARLEAGQVSLADMADQYTQYSLSKEKHGDLGIINQSENATYTRAFNEYVFNPDSPVGPWSRPLRETELWTKGSYWLVKTLEREDNRKVGDEDRNTLVTRAFSDWFAELTADPDLKVDNELLTDEIQQWVLERAQKKYPPKQVQSP